MMALATQVRFNLTGQPLPAALKAFATSQNAAAVSIRHGRRVYRKCGDRELDTPWRWNPLRHSGLEIIYSSAAPHDPPGRKPAAGRASLRSRPIDDRTHPALPQVTIRGEEDIDKQVHLFVSAVTRLASSPGSGPRSRVGVNPSVHW